MILLCRVSKEKNQPQKSESSLDDGQTGFMDKTSPENRGKTSFSLAGKILLQYNRN